MPSPADALSDELGVLRELLDEVLVASGVPNLASDVAALAAAAERGDPDEAERIATGFADIQAELVARAFTVHFHLVNLAEEREHARLLRVGDDPVSGQDALWPAMATVGDAAQDPLAGLEIHPVLTAHPTEARRRAVVNAVRRIAEQLDRRAEHEPGTTEHAVARRRLLEEVEILWRTAPLRQSPPGPVDEVRTAMAVFDHTLIRIAPRLYRAAEVALGRTEVGAEPPGVPAFLRFGSWIGGDRDGNPNVTASVTRDAMAVQADHVLRALEQWTDRVARTLTVDIGTTPPSPELRDQLAMAAAAHPELFAEAERSSPGEPHRQAMLIVAARVAATRRRDADLAYRGPGQLLESLRLVQTSLADAGARRAAYGELQHLIWQVETFGFHLAELEVRQHSRVHAGVLADLLAQVPGIDDPARAATDAELLDRLARDGWPVAAVPITTQGAEVLATFRVMAALQERWGPQCCGRYIVSFTQSAADLAAVAALARLAVGGSTLRLQVVPLFETGDDLRHCVDILDEWAHLPGTKEVLDHDDQRVEVMLGYSDSAKDVGPTSATLTLYDAQARLVDWGARHGIALTMFHGRGGSLGRGGGPLHRAIVAQPPGSVAGRFKVTEQGEVISARYGNATVGQRHLERVTAAVIQAGTAEVAERNRGAHERFRPTAATLESAARASYLELVGTDGFADFLAAVSPLDEMGLLRLGSRPPKRAGALTGRDLADLRAIPWVFSWSLTRANVPGWYGLGAGLDAVGDMAELRAAYRHWPLFATLIDVAEMSLAKTDRALAARFLALGDHPELAQRILTELDRTIDGVLAIVEQERLLGGKPRLGTALDARIPPANALSYLQLRALRAVRNGADGEHAQTLLLLCVNGVAAALQNTG